MRLSNQREGAFFLDTVLPKLECHLFPACSYPGSPFLKINNDTFSHWKKTWEQILQLKDGSGLPSDNFLRQDMICAIRHEAEVVGMIAASYFCLDQLAYEYHSYLQPFLASSGFDRSAALAQQVMSIEYLSVVPKFRKGELGISLGSVLLGISMEVFRSSDSCMVLGTARSKIHVDEMCYKFGFTPCGEMEKFGHPCTLILNTKDTVRRHDDLLVVRAVRTLWEQRKSYFESATPPHISVAA